MSADSPIGVFDSGIGGLSVLHHIRAKLPRENLIYVADRQFMPYGDKCPEQIVERTCWIADFLVSHSVKAIVVACNTATAAAVNVLREKYPLPIIGMEPGIKPAVASSRKKSVGVLATAGTIASSRFKQLLKAHADHCRIHAQACSGWVEHIEQNGSGQSQQKHDLIDLHIQPLMKKQVDSLVLGCTHYPFLADDIRRCAGDQVSIIDTGLPVSEQLYRQLIANDLINDQSDIGTEQFWANGSMAEFNRLIDKLWQKGGTTHALPEA